jgi:3-oxoacyl-[acyl-carrier-protein] synthase-1
MSKGCGRSRLRDVGAMQTRYRVRTAAMTNDLELLASGAVTAVGLTAAQTCAAIRAGIKRNAPIEAQILAHQEPRIGARVSADSRLRSDDAQWLLNLAARALRECEPKPDPATVLLYLVPEQHRAHPLGQIGDSELLVRLELLMDRRFGPSSRVLRSGAAGCVEALGLARELIDGGVATRCLIGGADSLLRRTDLDALGRDNRLLGPTQSQGLVPGEGAAFMLLGRSGPDTSKHIRVRGLGIGYESNTVLGSTNSVGEAFSSALTTAIADAGISESEIDFVAGNYNGERYDAWETSHANARSYRTRRERLQVMWPAASVGEIGVAAGVLAIVAAATAIMGEYAIAADGAAGTIASVQVRSDGELRGVVVLSC